MIPKGCRRLAEVDFPIAAVSKHAAREKSIRHGHPSTLHLWWARRPLASCRAMLLALLLPDPGDPLCPAAFTEDARRLLPAVVGPVAADAADLRRKLLRFIADFANWDVAANPTYLEVGRSLVRAAHGEETPLVDPFAGGGSIPLEALRLGCETFASDLNPVACLILKVLLEDIPRHGPTLAEELRTAGGEIKAAAQRELADLYPADPDGATPIAYLWARTVRCEAPRCGAEIPLLRSFWLCRKPKRKWALRVNVVRPEGAPPRVEFAVFEPETDHDVRAGTVTRAKAACPCCGIVVPPERVRAQLAAQRGGADAIFDEQGKRVGGARLTAVVTLRPGETGRHYRLPTDADYAAVRTAQSRLADVLGAWERGGKQGLCPVPDEPLPPIGTLGFRVQRYGMLQWGDLFTARQKVALVGLLSSISDRASQVDGLALFIGKVLRHCNVIAKWHTGSETVAGAFAMGTVPMSWDFPEMYPLVSYAGGVGNAVQDVIDPTDYVGAPLDRFGQVQLADAMEHPLPDQTSSIWFTDPPYYDAIPYADLSDFFFVWLRRILPDRLLFRDPFDADNPLSPKEHEAVWDETKRYKTKVKDRDFFEDAMSHAFAEGHRVLHEDGIGSVVFAHKTTEGWEALLSGLIRGGWTITGSWPIATERGARLRARDSAALATSVHLICRPRPNDAPVGDWAVVLRELQPRVGDWMERLQGEGVRGADLVFACIGPALEIFSRHPHVETAEGRAVGLPEYLEKVWEVVGRTALHNVLGTAEAQARNGMAGALEEDARLTALFLWTLQSTGADAAARAEDAADATPHGKPKGESLIFDVVRRFAQPLGIDLPKWEGRIIETSKGVVRLLPVTERGPQLFGEDGAAAAAEWMERAPGADVQQVLFPAAAPAPAKRSRGRKGLVSGDPSILRPARGPQAQRHRAEMQTPDATTLDRVHAAMLLQASGRSHALRSLLRAEQERGPDFLRLANALSALYPSSGEEKRLLDAMLLAVPR